MKIVKIGEKDKNKSYLAFAITFILPSVILNSAAWAQCDSIYTMFLIMCLYFILLDKDYIAMICFSFSFTFKIQAVFFAPFILLLILKKKIRMRTVGMVPIIYLVSLTPALIVDGDFIRLLTVYFKQVKQYSILNMNVPNIWAFFKDISLPELGKAGIFFAGTVILIILYYFIMQPNFKMSNEVIISLALFFSFLMPFLLPYMHERYFYLSDVLCIIFIFYFSKQFWMLFSTQFCSVQAIIPFLFGGQILDLKWLTVIELINIIVVFFTIKSQIIKENLLLKWEKI